MSKHIIHKLFLVAISLFCLFSCTNKTSNDETTKKEDGKALIETGELAAINTKSFTLERYGRYWFEMKIIGILEHGTIVEPGDSIIQLDPTEIKKFIIDKETNLETQRAILQKMLVDQANRINELEASIKNEEATFTQKKIELEASRFETPRLRKIKDLEFEQARINLSKEKKKLEINKIVEACDLKIQTIRVKQLEQEVKEAYNILPRLTVRTPISGVFQVGINRRNRALLKIGDGVYPGNNLANVPELKWMKVNTVINETDFLKIKIGQKVAIRLDALPRVIFDGEIAYIGKLCYLRNEKSKQKVFDVEVRISKPDERLKPGMTVSCEFL